MDTSVSPISIFVFFKDTATTEIYTYLHTLSLHDALPISRRAGTALGSFYTYFDSKEEIFQALVRYMSEQLRDHVTPIVQAAPDEIAAERIGLESFLGFVSEHRDIYRIIDEAEFVDYASYRRHYETTVERIRQRLEAGAARGEIR